MSFTDFINKYGIKIKTTSNVKFSQVLSSLSLNDVGIYSRDGTLSSDIGSVNLHPTKGRHWVAYINEIYFESSGCICPKKLSKFTTKSNGPCLYSDYKIQGQTSKRDFVCASFLLCIIYLTKAEGLDFKTVVLTMYYQRNSRL